ncbi:hypothetical protein OUZ56_024729 [Daphnia magna]|uniref:Uncharacterized protein n=1 Tax=Daphnia magna TaxID=35525 RepID=A0ABQ9ZIV0_9CRUS|nr:hypothetical protein OUZ56_024729 [Daphnia magna]
MDWADFVSTCEEHLRTNIPVLTSETRASILVSSLQPSIETPINFTSFNRVSLNQKASTLCGMKSISTGDHE